MPRTRAVAKRAGLDGQAGVGPGEHSAADVGGREAALGGRAGGHLAAAARAADERDGPVGWQLADSAGQVAEGNVARVGGTGLRALVMFADVDEHELFAAGAVRAPFGLAALGLLALEGWLLTHERTVRHMAQRRRAVWVVIGCTTTAIIAALGASVLFFAALLVHCAEAADPTLSNSRLAPAAGANVLGLLKHQHHHDDEGHEKEHEGHHDDAAEEQVEARSAANVGGARRPDLAHLLRMGRGLVFQRGRRPGLQDHLGVAEDPLQDVELVDSNGDRTVGGDLEERRSETCAKPSMLTCTAPMFLSARCNCRCSTRRGPSCWAR